MPPGRQERVKTAAQQAFRMTVDSVTSPELLAAELAAIEDLLQNYEDWRAWAQLEARERQGELPPAVAASGLKALLLDKLANNPLFLRRQALVKQLEHVSLQARTSPRSPSEADDLTRIRGIDVRLERRLNNLAVRSWSQIAHWTPADEQYFASTLGLGDLIARDGWIEQAAGLSGLATRTPTAPPASPQPASTVVAAPPPPAESVPAAVGVAPAVPLPDPENMLPPAAVAAAPAPRRAPMADLEAAPAIDSPKVPVAPTHDTPVPEPAAIQPPEASAPSGTIPAPDSASAPSPAEKSVTVEEPGPSQPAAAKAAEPEYPLLPPALPLAASAYAGYVPKPPSAVPLERAVRPLKMAALGAAAEPTHAPEPAFGDLQPPAGAPAWYYDGAVVEPPHDLPFLRSTPLPLAASAFGTGVPVDSALQADAEKVHTNGNTEEPATKAPSDVLETTLPPLPLQPGKTATSMQPLTPSVTQPTAPAEPQQAPLDAKPSAVQSSPEPAPAADAPASAAPPLTTSAAVTATPAQLATIAAAAAAAAASASSSAVAKVPAARTATPTAGLTGTSAPEAAVPEPEHVSPVAVPSKPSPQPTTTPSPEDLLQLAARRAAAQAAIPPPLPAGAVPLPPPLAPSPAASASVQPSQARPNARPISLPVSSRATETADDGPVRGGAPEARVTIRRPDDGPAPPVIRNHGGTPVHLGRQPAGRFDGESYAAYHSEVEEAAVQIVKKTSAGAPSTRRAVPPLPASPPVQADPTAGARTAAEAAARAAAALNAQSAAARQAAQLAAPPPPLPATQPLAAERVAPGTAAPATGDPAQTVKKGAEKAAVTMGRFLKALTGQ